MGLLDWARLDLVQDDYSRTDMPVDRCGLIHTLRGAAPEEVVVDAEAEMLGLVHKAANTLMSLHQTLNWELSVDSS